MKTGVSPLHPGAAQQGRREVPFLGAQAIFYFEGPPAYNRTKKKFLPVFNRCVSYFDDMLLHIHVFLLKESGL